MKEKRFKMMELDCHWDENQRDCQVSGEYLI